MDDIPAMSAGQCFVSAVSAFVDDKSSCRRLLMARSRQGRALDAYASSSAPGAGNDRPKKRKKEAQGRAEGLELVGLLLDRLIEFQWDIDFLDVCIILNVAPAALCNIRKKQPFCVDARACRLFDYLVD